MPTHSIHLKETAMKGFIRITVVVLAALALSTGGELWTRAVAGAQGLDGIRLLAPALEKDKPLLQALKERQSRRSFADSPLSLQDLSNVLWSANGINRPESGGRTSPSAENVQDVEIYVLLKEGTYLYEPKGHRLLPVIAGDHRGEAGAQAFVATASLNLIYVSDLAKLDFTRSREDQLVTAAIDVGHCSQGVYLYGAAAGLAVVARTSVDGARMARLLKLRPEQRVLMGQTVGYPR